MSDIPPPAGAPLEERIVNDLTQMTKRVVSNAEKCVQESPLSTLLAGFACGYLLSHRTMRVILAAEIRLLGAIAGPAVTLYGAYKLYELARDKWAADKPADADSGKLLFPPGP